MYALKNMATSKPKPLSIANFQTGISDNALTDFYDMRGINNFSSPGVAGLNWKLNRSSKMSLTFSAHGGIGNSYFDIVSGVGETDGLTIDGCACMIDTQVPAGSGTFNTGTIYYIKKVNATTIRLYPTLVAWLADTGQATITTTTTTNITIIRPTTISQFATDGTNTLGLDVNGRVWANIGSATNPWYLIDGNTSGSSAANGVAYWNGYWFILKGTNLDLLKITNFSAFTWTWYLNWTPTNWIALKNYTHKTLVGQDGVLYFCNGQYVGALRQKVGQVFNHTSDSTYTIDTQALFITPLTTCLEEIGTYLLVGTDSDRIYNWDRIELYADSSVKCDEKYTTAMVNMGSYVYCFSGFTGNIYKTDGTSIVLEKHIPEHLTNAYYDYATLSVIYSSAKKLNNRILFTVSYSDGSNEDGGVFSYKPSTGSLIVENIIANIKKNPGSIFTFGDIQVVDNKQYCVSYRYSLPTTGSDYSIDTNFFNNVWQVLNATDYLGGSIASLTTAFYKLGTKYNLRTLDDFDIELLEKLPDSCGLKLYYRLNDNDPFTLIGDFSSTNSTGTLVGQKSYCFTKSLQVESIQFKVEMWGYLNTYPKLKNITAYYIE